MCPTGKTTTYRCTYCVGPRRRSLLTYSNARPAAVRPTLTLPSALPRGHGMQPLVQPASPDPNAWEATAQTRKRARTTAAGEGRCRSWHAVLRRQGPLGGGGVARCDTVVGGRRRLPVSGGRRPERAPVPEGAPAIFGGLSALRRRHWSVDRRHS
ncbi:hypothetical protein BDY21DRAFT_80402 [Lineolata rhizophorae]|uniref:Uncharacterized protein n=1 Tax=Lineolata rhizophorae TaxID=578093 RepID=A0A6A6NTU2_9PEZI|nr:hypothetical protein BDY21DRAFT_80402 [Lineolata rhizophorae]